MSKYTKWNLEMYHGHKIVHQFVQFALMKLQLKKNNDFQDVCTSNINEWTGVAVLCCHGKSSSDIPTS